MEWLSSFDVVDFGYTENPIPKTREHYNQWVNSHHHEPLHYLEGDRQEKRQDLANYYPEFQSALVFLFSYHPARNKLQELYRGHPEWNGLKLASYTMGYSGWDYHDFLKEKLEGIGSRLKNEYGLEFRLALDTHPVLERDLAQRAGLGWFGKNSMLINREHGSFFIIGSLLLNKKLNLKDKKADTDHCGQCTRCIEACPTEAIDPQTRTIVAKDCISTFTIEQFKLESEPSKKMDLTKGFIFGCDICQDVCPWNKRIDRHGKIPAGSEWTQKEQKILDFFLLRPVSEVHKNLEEISGKEFERYFQKTSFARSGKRGLLKNIRLYLRQKLNVLS